MDELKKKLGLLSLIYEDPETGKLDDNDFCATFGWNRTPLACDCRTKIVYYAESVKVEGEQFDVIKPLCPYIGVNGKCCRLIDGKLVAAR